MFALRIHQSLSFCKENLFGNLMEMYAAQENFVNYVHKFILAQVILDFGCATRALLLESRTRAHPHPRVPTLISQECRRHWRVE